MPILFVFLFLVHELEEILFLPAWLAVNRPLLEEKIASRRLLRAIDGVSRRRWIGIAAEKLLLVLLLTWLAMAWQLWWLWAGMVVAFSVHLVGHGIQSAVLCRPIPSLVTSLLLLPMCVAMIAIVGARYELGCEITPSAGGFQHVPFLILSHVDLETTPGQLFQKTTRNL